MPAVASASAVRLNTAMSRSMRQKAGLTALDGCASRAPRLPPPYSIAPAFDGDRKRHAALVHRHAEMLEEAAQVGVVHAVEHDEAGVDGHVPATGPDCQGAGMTAQPVRRLEQHHIVRARKEPRGREAGNARTDDRDPATAARRLCSLRFHPQENTQRGLRRITPCEHSQEPVIRNAAPFVQWGMGKSGNVIGFPYRRLDGASGGDAPVPPAAAHGEPGRNFRDSEAGRMAARLQAVADRGDRAAFTELFRHFAPRVRAYLLRGGGGAGRADDVLQQTFEAVWRKAKLYDPRRANPAAWIFAIARNARIDFDPPGAPARIRPAGSGI